MLETTKISVKLDGVADIMFERFIDHSEEARNRPSEQKLYLTEGNKVVLPAENIWAFLFGEYPGGCAKTFEGKKGKEFIRVGTGHVFINPSLIQFMDADAGKPIVFKAFKDRFWINETAPRVRKGSLSIKQPNRRPVMRLPWALDFTITLIKNHLIDVNKLRNWFEAGGLQIGLANGRPRFGRFLVGGWEVLE